MQIRENDAGLFEVFVAGVMVARVSSRKEAEQEIEFRHAEILSKIEGLEEDLKSAVEVAWHRGATEWVKLNYPRDAERLERDR